MPLLTDILLEPKSSNAQPIHPEETISVDPETGAEKGTKPARFDLIPTDAIEKLARVFGYGSQKYEDNNWRKGYNWSLSYAAALRHLNAFWGGEDLDPESGLPHVSHAAWHCLVLTTFMKEQPGKDDRFKSQEVVRELTPNEFKVDIPSLSEEEQEMLVESGIITRDDLNKALS